MITLSGFYSKVQLYLEIDTVGANVNDFATVVEVDKRITDLKTSEHSLKLALNAVEREKETLEKFRNSKKV